MGKRLNQTDLLDEIDIQWNILTELLDSLSSREMTKRGRNEAGWAIKDVLTHLFDWQERLLGWVESGKRGETPELPAPGYKWNQIRELNESIFRRHRQKSLDTVRNNLLATHARVVQEIKSLSKQELTELGFYSWTGKSWTLSDYIRANTSSHYIWAIKKIKRWLKDQGN